MKKFNKALKTYKPFFSLFEKEVIDFLEELRNQHSATVDIYSINSRIKSLESITDKINNSNGKFSKVKELQDVAGIRVICHCGSDLERFDTILREEIKKKYPEFVRDDSQNKSGYRGIHYVLKKEFQINGKNRKLMCEIQLRTVMQDAWAVQSHQYGYKRKVEGDVDILKQTVSGILYSCENLWELVKKNVKGGESPRVREMDLIYKDITEKVEYADDASRENDIERMVASNKIMGVEDILDKEYITIKEEWEKIYASNPPLDKKFEILSEVENLLKNTLAIGLLSIKHNKLLILGKVLDTFGKIASLSDGKSGYKVILSIPSASLHNLFYYFGAYALQKLNKEAILLLLDYKMEREHSSRLYYSRIWESGSVIAPEIFGGAEKTFNYLLESFPKNDVANTIISSDEEFLNLACQFNMLYCFKAAAEKEAGIADPWAYPNFGRFYASRVSRFIDRAKNKEEYQQFIEYVFKEKFVIFANKFNSRLKIIGGRGLGSGLYWDSIESWEGR